VAIANWGPEIVFTVSDLKVFTFRDTKRTVGAQWATHSRIGQKDQTEYLRPDLQEFTFTMDLDVQNGVCPRTLMDKLNDYCERGCIFPLVVGGHRVGRYKWSITKLSEAWQTVYNKGELAQAKVDVTMQEYV